MTNREVMLAHQYLYYVECRPIWSDYEYDKFCESKGMEGNGGSDLASDYSEEVIRIAHHMISHPERYPPNCYD